MRDEEQLWRLKQKQVWTNNKMESNTNTETKAEMQRRSNNQLC